MPQKSHLDSIYEDPEARLAFCQERASLAVSDLVLRRMEDLGVSQNDLVRKCGKKLVNRILDGHPKLTLNMIVAVLDALDCALTFGTDDFLESLPRE